VLDWMLAIEDAHNAHMRSVNAEADAALTKGLP